MDAALTLDASNPSGVSTWQKIRGYEFGCYEAKRTQLRGDSFSFAETLGQSIANIGPTLTRRSTFPCSWPWRALEHVSLRQ
jgi:hypothetical protein